MDILFCNGKRQDNSSKSGNLFIPDSKTPSFAILVQALWAGIFATATIQK